MALTQHLQHTFAILRARQPMTMMMMMGDDDISFLMLHTCTYECTAFKMHQLIASALPSKARLECHNGHGSVWLGALAQHYLWHSNGHMSSNSQLPP